MRKRSSKSPSDVNQLAKSIVDQAITEGSRRDSALPGEPSPPSGKNPAAVALGRLGGLKGGKARAAKLSAEARRKIAQRAAKARWAKKANNK